MRKLSIAINLAVAAAVTIGGQLIVASAADAELLRVGKAGREAFSFVAADVGADVGIYKKYGLDLEISGFGGDARLQQAMTADGIDIGLGSGPGLAFIVKGSPVKGIAATAGPPLLFALMVRNDDTIKTVADLKGHKVGVSTVGSVTSWIISEVAQRNGWGPGGITQVPVGEDSSRIAAVRTKSIDAAIVNLAVALKFVQSGDGRILLRFNDLLKDFHTHVIFATDKAIATKSDTLRAFVKGWFESVTYMRKDKPRTVAISKEIMGTDLETTNGIYDELMPMFTDDGHFDPKALAVLARSFVEMKTLPNEPDMSKLYTEEFLPKK